MLEQSARQLSLALELMRADKEKLAAALDAQTQVLAALGVS